MRPVYATVEQVMRAADIKASAYATDAILSALVSASDDVDSLVKLGDAVDGGPRPAFAPWVGQISFDWPRPNNDDAYRFWLGRYRLNAFTAVTSGGTDMTASALGWPASGVPYSALEIDTETSDSFDVGPGTGQRSLAITGTWGTLGRDETRSAWTLGGTLSSSADTITINAPVGIGSLLLVDSERLIVIARSWVTSGQSASALTAQANDQAIAVSDGSAFLAGETIVIDSERMLIREIIGNTLTVARATDGSTLAAHAGATTIYWQRSCTIERAALGTSAAAHSSGALVSIYRPPALVEQLTMAYATDRRSMESAGYARSMEHIRDRQQLSSKKVGGDVGAVGIPALEERLVSAYGRIRHMAI